MIPKHIQDYLLEHIGDAPLFIYDVKSIEKTLQSLSSLATRASIFYAMKANPHRELVKMCLRSPTIEGIEIASVGEAKVVLQTEPDLSRVIYTGPSKTPADLEFVMSKNIKTINLESLVEAQRVSDIGKKLDIHQKVLLRVNTNFEVHGATKVFTNPKEPSAFGIDEDFASEAIRYVSTLPNVYLEGIHTFSATGVLSSEVLLEGVRYSKKLFESLKTINRDMNTLDLGGGFGVDYEGDTEFDLGAYTSKLRTLFSKDTNTNLILELGRYIIAEHGYFVTTINDIKSSRGGKVVLTDAGINAHRRPYALNISYPIEILDVSRRQTYDHEVQVRAENVQVHGPLCTSADVLAPNAYIEYAKIGDLLIMPKSGAYGYSMSAKDFLSNDKIKEVWV